VLRFERDGRYVENGVVLTAGSVRSTFTSLPDLPAFFAAFLIAFFSFLNFLLSLDIACSLGRIFLQAYLIDARCHTMALKF
jgi:hypothetical protein